MAYKGNKAGHAKHASFLIIQVLTVMFAKWQLITINMYKKSSTTIITLELDLLHVKK